MVGIKLAAWAILEPDHLKSTPWVITGKGQQKLEIKLWL